MYHCFSFILVKISCPGNFDELPSFEPILLQTFYFKVYLVKIPSYIFSEPNNLHFVNAIYLANFLCYYNNVCYEETLSV